MVAQIFSAIAIFFQSLFGINGDKNILPADISAQISEPMIFMERQIAPTMPVRNWDIDEIDIDAVSAIAFDLKSEKILYEKNINDKRPIASLTKILTASTFLENISVDDLDKTTIISKNAVDTYGEMGDMFVGEKIAIKGLLYMLLLQSSNDAAVAMQEYLTEKGLNLIDLMNQKTTSLDLKNTFFIDSSGLDQNNISSAWDLAQITKYAMRHSLIWEIMQLDEINLYSADGRRNHHLKNTNKLLNRLPEIIGGKTGYTEEAGECMILVMKIPDKENKIILIVLGASNRFVETEKLANWISNAYVF